MADEATIIDLDEEDDEAEDPSEVASTIEQIAERCKTGKIPVEVRESGAEGISNLAVGMPCGKERRWLSLWGLERLKEFLAIPFERYTFLGRYEAVCSYEEDYIEASIEAISRVGGYFLVKRMFSGNSLINEIDPAEWRIEVTDSSGLPRKVIMDQVSSDLRTLTQVRRRPGLAIKMLNFGATRHDQALNLLERVSNSLFFQIDMTRNLPLSLVRDRSSFRPRVSGGRRPAQVDLEFPQTEYNEAPISLYWYARSASGMPLLQYLAYYQAIEYYFPVYSQAEAIRKVRNVLKSPAFRRDSDDDIGRIVGAVKTGGSSGFGDEKSQLRATMLECLDPDELRLFLVSNDERREFFSSQAKSLTSQRIPINKAGADLRNDVSDRIYDIRCKIVHTKGGGREAEVELLLPFSREAELLYFDIALIQYVARQVLIAASTPIRLQQ